MNNLTTTSTKIGSILFLVISIVVSLVALPYIIWGIGFPLLGLGIFLIYTSTKIQTSRIATIIAASSTSLALILFGSLSYIENVLSHYNPGQHHVGIFEYTILTTLLLESFLLLFSLKRTDYKNNVSKGLAGFQMVLFAALFSLSVYAFYHEFIYPSIRNYSNLNECISEGYTPRDGIYNDKCSQWFTTKEQPRRFIY